MFKRPGDLLQIVATLSAGIGILASVVGGAYVVALGWEDPTGQTALIGVAIVIGGSLASWITNLSVYAFGQLVEDVGEIAQSMRDEKSSRTSRTEG